ncbi:MAG: glycosyltransferase family 2 protein [Phycisphaerales bacterium]
MNIAYIIPTRDRSPVLAETVRALGALPPHSAQVVVADNASAVAPALPARLGNGLDVVTIRLGHNAGAAARNTGVAAADPSCAWVVMLDDDSAPMDLGHLHALRDAPPDAAAVAAEIFLPRRGAGACGPSRGAPRESGGLPEVFIGCGVAIRRDAFLACGGYDPSFGFYAEEYDLAARFLLSGRRVVMDRRFRVEHRKVSAGRDMDMILGRLVRNNGWVAQRYAPARRRVGEIRRTVERYRAIAAVESALAGFRRGEAELLTTLRSQPRTPMSRQLWDRFTGLAAARARLSAEMSAAPFATATLVDEGKNAHVVRRALRELGVRLTTDEREADALVIGTLSPGPLLDAWERRTRGSQRRVVRAWSPTAAAETGARELHAA